MTTADRAAQPVRSDSIFFPLMAVAMATAIFAGFARSFYLKPVFHAPPELSGLMMMHGAVFTLWTAILVTQTGLVAANRRDIHMRLGWFGVAVAALMVVLGSALALDALHRGFVPPGSPVSPSMFFAIPILSMVAFPIMVGLGVANRGTPAVHKRYMLLSTALLLEPAIARFPFMWIENAGPLAFFPLADLAIAAMAIYDLVSLRRVHSATLWAALIVLGSQVASLAIGGTTVWHAFTMWMGGPA